MVSGLYQISGTVNVFILDDGENGITIIDAGMPRSVNKIVDTVKAIGRTVSDVKQILITHADMDHIGSLGPLVHITQAKVITGDLSKPYIESRQAPPHLPVFMKPFTALITRLMISEVEVDQTVADGDVLPIAGGIHVIATPGHTPDNVSYYWERERVLFAPDLLNMMTKDTLSLTKPIVTWNMQIAKESAKQVLDLNPAYICVGHGRFIEVAKEPEQIDNLRKLL